MEKINFEDGQLVTPASVNIEGTQYLITEAEYEGVTPLSAFVLNKMQDNIEKAIVNTPATQEQAGLMSPEDKTKLDNYVGGITGDTLPIGSIVEWASDTVPANWLLCNGQAVSRTDYAELFSVLGTSYGEGDGSTTFNLPNSKGRVAVGKDDNDTDFNVLGKTGGEKEHVLTIEEMPEHNHPAPSGYDTSNWYLMYGEAYSKPGTYAGGTYPYVTPNKNAHAQGGSQPHNNLQPFVVTNFIIKAHQSAGVVAEVIQEDEQASSTNVYSAEATKQAIENTKSWKFHKEVTGTEQINIAGLDFTELLIVAKFNNTDGNYVLGSSLVLPKEILTETLEYYDMGSTVCIIRIGASKTSIVLNMSTAYNNDFASTTNIRVFYK